MAQRKARQPGIFVTFEGTEGAGKSTLIQAVAKALRARRPAVGKIVVTREPGGIPVAEKIREILLHQEMDPWTELFMYEAARAEHLAKVILPALKARSIVLCDRFTDSSLAYQSHARGLPWKQVHQLNDIATQGISPDLSVFLDIDPALGLKHAQVQTRFEKEGVKFQKKVRAGFLKAIREDRSRWLVMKARSAAPEIMAEKVLERIYGR